jgi:hypothetical protein
LIDYLSNYLIEVELAKTILTFFSFAADLNLQHSWRPADRKMVKSRAFPAAALVSRLLQPFLEETAEALLIK